MDKTLIIVIVLFVVIAVACLVGGVLYKKKFNQTEHNDNKTNDILKDYNETRPKDRNDIQEFYDKHDNLLNEVMDEWEFNEITANSVIQTKIDKDNLNDIDAQFLPVFTKHVYCDIDGSNEEKINVYAENMKALFNNKNMVSKTLKLGSFLYDDVRIFCDNVNDKHPCFVYIPYSNYDVVITTDNFQMYYENDRVHDFITLDDNDKYNVYVSEHAPLILPKKRVGYNVF